jgi:hypothetical protein
MSQMNRVSIVRNDFPEKDTGIQMYVKLKGLKDKKGKKEANKQKTNKITPKEDREYKSTWEFQHPLCVLHIKYILQYYLQLFLYNYNPILYLEKYKKGGHFDHVKINRNDSKPNSAHTHTEIHNCILFLSNMLRAV